MSQTSVYCQECRAIHPYPFATQAQAEQLVGSVHEEEHEGHNIGYVTTSLKLGDMVFDITSDVNAQGWVFKLLNI